MSGEWVELDNGCLCCSVKNDFVLALESLMRKKQKPEAIVIETTGRDVCLCVCVCVRACVCVRVGMCVCLCVGKG
jgi:hypothetical protein